MLNLILIKILNTIIILRILHNIIIEYSVKEEVAYDSTYESEVSMA